MASVKYSENDVCFTPDQCGRLRRRINPGRYAAVDVSQTKAKGLSACVISVSKSGTLQITYYHQPFVRSIEVDANEHIAEMVDAWPEQLLRSHRVLIDSPLNLAASPGGRDVDRKEKWTGGFEEYLNSEPQHAPTSDEIEVARLAAVLRKQEKRKGTVTWAATQFTWIEVGIALDQHLRDVRKVPTGEVYPTACFNALHRWKQVGLDISLWCEKEPDEFYLLRNDAPPLTQSLRYLDRVRASPIQEVSNRFRKLSYWPYPDLWDAFAGAIACMLDAAGLAESVESPEKPAEGGIIVPMRLSEIRDRMGRGEL